MLLLQFSGNPLYKLFFYLFLFFRKHKQNKKINVLREKIEYQTVVFNITIFNVGYHGVDYVGENASAIFKTGFFTRGERARPLKNATFCSNYKYPLSS
jgi:hypothetical protein